MLKEQVEALIHENAVLKRAVSIQHERQKEFEDRGQELHHLKQMVSQYQEQLRTLEVKIPNPEISKYICILLLIWLWLSVSTVRWCFLGRII